MTEREAAPCDTTGNKPTQFVLWRLGPVIVTLRFLYFGRTSVK